MTSGIETTPALPLIGGALKMTRGSQTCSPAVWMLLTEGDDWKQAVRRIATTPAYRDQIEAALPAIERLASPSDPEALLVLLIEKAPTYGVRSRSAGEWGAVWSDYLLTLAQLPLEAVEDAFLRWNRCELYPDAPGRQSVYPKPSELYTLAQHSVRDLGNAKFRAKQALAWVERLPPPAPSAEEQAEVKRGMAELAAQLGGKPNPLTDNLRPVGSQHQAAERLRSIADDLPASTDEEGF
jgi:hypothetical protein